MNAPEQLVVTAWRNRAELLKVRQDLYSSTASERERALSKVFAWRFRKPNGLPLLLDSTADIVDVILQDEKGLLGHNATRLLYAAALSRFITGILDTQTELLRDRPAWFPPGKSLELPTDLFEVRHRIVHRHLPTLHELKCATQQSLDWLWEWYWSQLDHAFSVQKSEVGQVSTGATKEQLSQVLKSYVKERKAEIKTDIQDMKAAQSALSKLGTLYAASEHSPMPRKVQDALIQLLVIEKMLLPSGRKLGSSMSGAFLLWTPFLLAVCASRTGPLFTSMLIAHMMKTMNSRLTSHTMVNKELDPIREGMYNWLVHMMASDAWNPTRSGAKNKLVDDTLSTCFSEPTSWNLKLAAHLLHETTVPNVKQWRAVLEIAQSDDIADGQEPLTTAEENHRMDMQMDEQEVVEEQPSDKQQGGKLVKKNIQGPMKVLGVWKPTPIGWLSPEYEHLDD